MSKVLGHPFMEDLLINLERFRASLDHFRMLDGPTVRKRNIVFLRRSGVTSFVTQGWWTFLT